MFKNASKLNSLTIFVPYRPPSRNEVDGGSLRQRMKHKQDARSAWLSASSDYAESFWTMTIMWARANTSGTPSPPPSASTTATNDLPGSISNATPKAKKG
jgi:hypothetical protein